jgi:predicted ribosome quality control (RQC) complex YloA/Tae2 family protein
LPFHTFSIQGFTVWVGKHARANELLLNQYSKKNDVWFHARDVAGSHVVVRSARGLEGLPKPVMEGAARLAAWFSKGRSQGWLPVQYTERKYVRKRKGGAPGEVLVEKEKVLVVQPGLP